MATLIPTIPETITVHLGRPEENARNVTLPFLDYVANVASSEIYPTWPENAIRANMYAQVSFALNRIYTEFYRSRGYDFDITSSTSIDQAFVEGRDIFENIRELAGQLFDSYIRRQGAVEPLFAVYCDGRRVSCNGLSQWGSVELAEQGLTPYEILTYYYGDNIDIVSDAPIANTTESAPTPPLRVGSANDQVRTAQIRLNRISQNYPSIPKIALTDGVFTTDTEAAVRRFQEIFGLTPDGVIGRATWYYIRRIYNGVKRLNEVNAEGVTLEEVTQQYPGVLREGDSGNAVANLQYYINYLSAFYDTVPPLAVDGSFGSATRAAVIDLQNTFGLPADGIVGPLTWEALYDAYLGIVATIPPQYTEGNVIPFPGRILRLGSDSDDVRVLQEYLNYVARSFPTITPVSVTGYFGPRTREAVIAFQELAGLPVTGQVSAITWEALGDLYSDLYNGQILGEGQYPGFETGVS
ncbi:MAG: spore cortex-lytic protein [Ruminococcaceae bacterium]|nr:spore cortex-lytic protein [Oscillospiraceae bacterium]